MTFESHLETTSFYRLFRLRKGLPGLFQHLPDGQVIGAAGLAQPTFHAVVGLCRHGLIPANGPVL